MLLASANGDLGGLSAEWSETPALCVVMANAGYPGAMEPGSEIKGLQGASESEGVTIFHAGTRLDGHRLVAAGGRVLNVCASTPTILEARQRAYAALDRIDWPEGFCRRDIAWRAL